MVCTNLYKELKNLLISFEEKRADFYPDSVGIPTVGIGFALVVDGGGKWVIRPEKVLKEYLNLNNEQINYLAIVAKRKNDGKSIPKEVIEEELKGWANLSEQQIEDIYQYTINEAKKTVLDKISLPTWERLNIGQQMALIECAFRKGSINHVGDYVKQGNFQAVADVFISDATKPNKDGSTKPPSIITRAKLEAELYLHGGFDKNTHIVTPELSSFSKIAAKYKITQKQLQDLNPDIADISKIYPGQKILLGAKPDYELLEDCAKEQVKASTSASSSGTRTDCSDTSDGSVIPQMLQSKASKLPDLQFYTSIFTIVKAVQKLDNPSKIKNGYFWTLADRKYIGFHEQEFQKAVNPSDPKIMQIMMGSSGAFMLDFSKNPAAAIASIENELSKLDNLGKCEYAGGHDEL